jgi:hypothetical protein
MAVEAIHRLTGIRSTRPRIASCSPSPGLANDEQADFIPR